MTIDINKCAEEILEIGHCVLPAHFPSSALDEFHKGFLQLFEEVSERIPEGNRGPQRWAIGLPFAPPFYHSALFNDGVVNAIVERILGENSYIPYYGTDTPMQGSEYQRIHADLPFLFPEEEDHVHPPLTLSVRFVSVDMTFENGPFESAERTQNLPRNETIRKAESGQIPLKPVMLKAGDALITDPRNLHRGTPNQTDTPRPFAVIVYNRSWYWTKKETLEANESTPQLKESFFKSLSPNEQHMLRMVPRTDG